MAYNFITIGGATRDISFFTDQEVLIDNPGDVLRQKLLAFEYGAKIKVDKFYYAFGGGAANAAVTLANFGLRTACLCSLGNDEDGKLIIRNLKNRHVATNLIERKSVSSGSSFILIAPGGERIIFGARGANRELEISPAQLKIIKQAKNIYLASLSGNWQIALKRIFSAVGSHGPQIAWNPGASQYKGGFKKLAPYLRKTKVFSLNKDEAIELVLSSSKHKKWDNKFLNKTENLIKIIKSFGPEIVVITLGHKGVMAYTGQKIYFQPIMKEKKRVDTTGVGDIFNSSFAAGLELYSGDITRALKLGLKNTASKIAHLGAQNGLIKFKK
jgi:sugar/nucleoside kinase (ribokinase family)